MGLCASIERKKVEYQQYAERCPCPPGHAVLSCDTPHTNIPVRTHTPLLDERRPQLVSGNQPSGWTGIGTDTSAAHSHPAFGAQELRGGHTSCDPAPPPGLWVSGSASTGQLFRQHDVQHSAQKSR